MKPKINFQKGDEAVIMGIVRAAERIDKEFPSNISGFSRLEFPGKPGEIKRWRDCINITMTLSFNVSLISTSFAIVVKVA